VAVDSKQRTHAGSKYIKHDTQYHESDARPPAKPPFSVFKNKTKNQNVNNADKSIAKVQSMTYSQSNSFNKF